MKNINNYVAGIMAASSLFAAGCAYNPMPMAQPIDPTQVVSYQERYNARQKNTLDSLAREYTNQLAQTRNDYREAIQDFLFTVHEQEGVLNGYARIDSIKQQLLQTPLGANTRPGLEDITTEEKNLVNRLDHNLNGNDMGTPELQWDYRKIGVEIDVESKTTFWDMVSIAGVLGCAGFLLWGQNRAIDKSYEYLKRQKS